MPEFRFCRQPHDVGTFDECVDHHEPLGRAARRHGPPIATVHRVGRRVQAVTVQVVNAAAIVATLERRCMTAPHELGEEGPRLLTLDDASERGVLALDAHARVPHHEVEEPGLPLGEPIRCEFGDPLFGTQPNISSARPPPRPPLRPPPPRPPMRTLMPRYAVKPDRPAAAACEPR